MEPLKEEKQLDTLNDFLVEIFNLILRIEENTIATQDLSVNELHVIEAIEKFVMQGNNTMGSLAKYLGITMGSLTTSVRTLENKGYVERRKSETDKRVVRVFLTEKANKANNRHKKFHRHMVRSVASQLSEEQLEVFTDSLVVLRDYFKQGEKK